MKSTTRIISVFAAVAMMAGCALNQEELQKAITNALVDAQAKSHSDNKQTYDLEMVVGRVIHYVFKSKSVQTDWFKAEGKDPVKATGIHPGAGIGSSPEACTPDGENSNEINAAGDSTVRVVGRQEINIPGSKSAASDADHNTIIAYHLETRQTIKDEDTKTNSVAIAAGGARTETISHSQNPGGTSSSISSVWSDGQYVYDLGNQNLVDGSTGLLGSVLTRVNPQAGDTWFNGSILYYTVGDEDVTIGEQTVRATKILMRRVDGSDPTGVDLLAECATVENSDPANATNNTQTLQLKDHCPPFGTITPLIVQTGYIWLYQNMIIRQLITQWVIRLQSAFFNGWGLNALAYFAATDTDAPADGQVDSCDVVGFIAPGAATPYKKGIAYSIDETQLEQSADSIEDTGVGIVDDAAADNSDTTK